MPKVAYESPGKIRRRGRAWIYHRGPLAKISHQKWPLETDDGGHSTYGNGNYPDIDAMKSEYIETQELST